MPGLIRGVARTAVVAGTATAVSNRVSRRQQGRWAAQQAPQAPPPRPESESEGTEGSVSLEEMAAALRADPS
ncbi:SHOCT domain-containing protein [Streptomyces finlayi]|uniref:SHOCT domain-containing protein n=1 Tax=Streptomyces finlayi TaxID=67296 RepID=UPI0035BC65FD